MLDFEGVAKRKGKLLVEKNKQYGNSYVLVPKILRIYYPNGIMPHQYEDASAMVRVLDKLCRRAAGNKDAVEDWGDVGGYGIVMEAYELWKKENKPIDIDLGSGL